MGSRIVSIIMLALTMLSALSLKGQDLNQTGLDFLSDRFGGEAVAASVDKTQRLRAPIASSLTSQFEVVNATVNDIPCFAIVVANGGDAFVIGYGDKAHATDVPEALLNIINSSSASRLVSQNTKPYEPVAPMIKTKWGQNEPFNLKAPMVDGEHGVAGCVAVAMAQVLNYWHSDQPGYDTIEYVDDGSKAEIQVDFSNIHYDWNLMLDDYSAGYTDAQAEEVARLMFECGAASAASWQIYNEYSNGKLLYSAKNTTAYPPYVALNRYYNFNCSFLSRNFTATPIFMETVRNELYAGRPLIYGGKSTQSSHSFVVDGLDEQGFGHINWGWNGEADGYYDLNFCMPSTATTTDEAYDNGQHLIYGIQPRITDEKYMPSFVAAGRICNADNIDNINVKIGITTNFYSSGITTVGYGPTDVQYCGFGWINSDNGALVSDCSPKGNYNVENYSYFPNYSKVTFVQNSIPPLPNNVPDGEYHYTIYNCDASGSVKYASPVLLDNTSRAVVKDGIATYTNRYDHPFKKSFSNISFHNPTAKSCLFIECDYMDESYNVDVQTPRVEFALTDVNTGDKYISDVVTFPSTYAGVPRHYQFAVQFTNDNGIRIPAGTYRLSSAEKSYVGYDCEDVVVEIAPQLSYPLMISNASDWEAELSQRGAVALWNGDGGYTKPQDSQISIFNRWYSCNKVTTPINVNFYAVSEESGKEYYLTTYMGYQPKERNLMNWIYPEGNLYPFQGDYYLLARYMTPDGEKPCAEPWYNAYTPAARFSVTASTSTKFQNLAINSIDRRVSVEEPKLSVSVSNNGTSGFYGTMHLTLRNLTDGRIIEAASDMVEIAQGKSAVATFAIDGLNVDDQFVASIKSVQSVSRTASSPTAVLDEFGDPAAFTLLVTDGTGISNISGDVDAREVARYNTMGMRLSKPTPGINIIILSNGKAEKVVVK